MSVVWDDRVLGERDESRVKRKGHIMWSYLSSGGTDWNQDTTGQAAQCLRVGTLE